MRNDIIKTLILAVFLCLFIFPAKAKAEFIFLKNGKIIQGTIVADKADTIVARVGGKKQTIRRSQVMRILYTSLKMGKVYIQKRDGTSVIAYIVDEDRNSYVCRTKLYSPKEFKINREDVLFVAEKNPSGLQGKADTTYVDLTWFPPYDKVKVYNIYAKTRRNDEYKKIASSTDKKATVKGLKSNTLHYFIVQSVDDDDYESSPSNEIKLRTKNIPPLAPEDYFAEKKTDGTNYVKWHEGIDPDGKVKSYNIYKVLNFRTTLVTTTSKTEHSLPADESFDSVYIKSVDNLKTESKDSIPIYFGPRPEINFSILPFYAFPLNTLKSITEPTFGIAVRGGISNYFLTGLDLFIEASFINFHGTNEYNAPEDSIENIMLLPFLLSAGYSFYPIRWIRISPSVHAGYCYIKNTYSHLDIINGGRKEVTLTAFDPVIGAGISVRWDFSMFFVGISADYRYIAEKSGHADYWTASPVAGIKF